MRKPTILPEPHILMKQIHLEKAVEIDPDSVEARFALMEYYLQAPALVGGDITKAKAQAEEIAKRNTAEGRKAWQRCEQEDEQGPQEETTLPQNKPPGTAQ